MESEVSSLIATHPAGFPSLVVVGKAAALKLFIPCRVSGWDEDPISKGRPKTRIQFGKNGNAYAQIYTPPRTREWEEWVETCVRKQLIELGRIDDGQVLTLPLQGRVILTLRFNLTRPKSVPKSVTIPPTAKGDIDNMSKSVLDGIQNARVIVNDRQVSDNYSYRRYADEVHPVGVEIDLTGAV